MRNSKSRFSALPGIVSGPLMVPPAHFVCQVDFERALAAISEGGGLNVMSWHAWRQVIHACPINRAECRSAHIACSRIGA